MGAPYKEKKIDNFKLEDEEGNDFGDCNISASNMEKSSMTCSVAYSYVFKIVYLFPLVKVQPIIQEMDITMVKVILLLMKLVHL